MKRSLLWIMFAALAIASRATALSPQQAQKIYDRISPSIVVVQFTMEGEFGRRELFGQGIVVGADGLVMLSMSVVPTAIPNEQMKDFRIIIPGDDEPEFPAVFVGRDERCDVAYVRTQVPQKWPAIKFEDVPLNIGDEIISVGRLPKDSGYKSFYHSAYVSSVLRGPVPFVLASPDGLTTVGSPVFTADGRAVGLVPFQTGQNQFLNKLPQGVEAINPPARLFVPARHFLFSVGNPPKDGPPHIPWLGAQLGGMNKSVAEYYGLKNVTVVQVGDVVPGTPATKAGLKTGDKIIAMNGQPLERGDEPEEAPPIFMRKIRRMNVGESATFTVVRARGEKPFDVRLVLEEQPKASHEAKRYYAEDLGMTMREVVFADTYAKRVPADTRAVVCAYVRQSSSAATAGLKLGDMVVQLNKTPIADLADFQRKYAEFRQRNPKDLVVLVVIREQRTEVIKIEPPQ